MAIGVLKWAHRPVNLATCAKGDIVCEDITECVPTQICFDACPPFPIPDTLTAIVSAPDCPGLNGSYTLTLCEGAWRTQNPHNHNFGGFGCNGVADGAAPVAYNMPLEIVMNCAALSADCLALVVSIGLGGGSFNNCLNIVENGQALAVAGPPLVGVAHIAARGASVLCDGSFTCTYPVAVTITVVA